MTSTQLREGAQSVADFMNQDTLPPPAPTSGSVIELKTWPEFFQPILDGVKTFEIRAHDRPFMVGSMLHLREFAPCRECGGSGRVWDNGDKCACHCTTGLDPKGYYTGRSVNVVVTYMTRFGQPKDQIVMGIRLASQNTDYTTTS